MKILADVNVSPRVVAELRSAGLDAVRVVDLLAPTAPDQAILEVARKSGAVVLSRDQDFSALLAESGETAPSLLNLRVAEVDSQRVARLIVEAVGASAAELAAGAIVTVDDAGMRVHLLPIGA